MKHSITFLKQTLQNDPRGVTAVEYALVAGALVAGVAAAFAVLTGSLSAFFGGLKF